MRTNDALKLRQIKLKSDLNRVFTYLHRVFGNSAISSPVYTVRASLYRLSIVQLALVGVYKANLYLFPAGHIKHSDTPPVPIDTSYRLIAITAVM